MIINLEAKKREVTGKGVKKLREKGLIPAVIYGPEEKKNKNLSLDYTEFEKTYEKAGESSLIDLKIDDNKPIKVLIYDVDLHPISGDFRHVDFYRIKEGQKLNATVELEFVGEAPATKELGGTLIKSFDSLDIECLPKDLISKIEVDLTPLKTFDDAILVKDLNIPETVKIFKEPDETVAKVTEVKEEVIEEEVSEEPEEGAEAEEKAEGEERPQESKEAETKEQEAGKEDNKKENDK